MNADLGLFVLRVSIGLIVVAHGLLKFGFFEPGRSITSVGGSFDRMGLHPGTLWAVVASLAESVGGILMVVGLGGPTAPVIVTADLVVVTIVAHLPQGFWVRGGKAGVEFPVALAAGAFAIALIGPGRWSLDGVLGIGYPEWLLPVWAALMVPGVAVAIFSRITSSRTPARVE